MMAWNNIKLNLIKGKINITGLTTFDTNTLKIRQEAFSTSIVANFHVFSIFAALISLPRARWTCMTFP